MLILAINPALRLYSVVSWLSFFVLFVALAKTYSFAIFGLCVGWCELQMCMAFSVGFLFNHFLFSWARNSLSVIVVNFSPLAFICSPLSEVKSIGFSFLNFKATVRIWLSGERLLKSTGSSDKSEISILKSLVSKRALIDFKALCTFLLLSSSSLDFK